MSKLLIGIPGFLNQEQMFGVTGNYMQFAHKYGDVRILMPHEEHVEVDLLILPGGLDLSPSKYSQVPGYKTTNHDVHKQFFFEERLKNYVESKTPIFGICLGFQMLNVFFGGQLQQHILYHEQSSSRWATAHEVYLNYTKKNDKGLHKSIKVNSHHHQAVGEGMLAECFNEVAHVLDNGVDGRITEAFMHNELPIAGVQWHPEELYDGVSDQMIRKILEM